MPQIRLAQAGEVEQLKEIWKQSFADKDCFINFYYANRFKAERTVVLEEAGELAAMLTVILLDLVLPDKERLKTAMLYAIATHPAYRNKGLARQLIEQTNQSLAVQGTAFSVLVPAEKGLFDFYYRQGYQPGFYLREAKLTREALAGNRTGQQDLCRISAADPAEYNGIRNAFLAGSLHIAYNHEDIAYQKEISRMSGADIYTVDTGQHQGCLAVERYAGDKLLIKELLLAEKGLKDCLWQLAHLTGARELTVRTPGFAGVSLGGIVRPFGLFKAIGHNSCPLNPGNEGYLGLAFD